MYFSHAHRSCRNVIKGEQKMHLMTSKSKSCEIIGVDFVAVTTVYQVNCVMLLYSSESQSSEDH